MKRMIVMAGLLYACLLASATEITFKFAPGSTAGVSSALKAKMERNISCLLTEIQQAGQAGRALQLAAVDMEAGAKRNLEAFWRILPFVCEQTVNVGKCLYDAQGYQVREILITMKPKDSSYKQSKERELTISLNKHTGAITGVRPAAENNEDYLRVMSEGEDVTDMSRRLEVLKFVEDFRCYYNQKNIEALRKIYSDKAIIITGSVISTKNANVDIVGKQMTQSVKYRVQNKEQYLTNLERVFQRSGFINVAFDKISVKKHNAKKNVYGVTLHQNWESSSYCDDGWVFLLWDFTDPEKPQIHVRTWQTDQMVAIDGAFDEQDFFIP